MCYLGDCWETPDGVKFWSTFFDGAIMARRGILIEFAHDIFKRRKHWASDVEWKHEMRGRCSWGMAVRRNGNKTIDETRTWNKELCPTCRGKGHPWKCAIWNGRPYLVSEGQRGPEGAHWKNPDWCKDCEGSGEA